MDKKTKFYSALGIVLLGGLILWSCKKNEPSTALLQNSSGNLKVGEMTVEPLSFTLLADQTNEVGVVACAAANDHTLTVTYTVTGEWKLDQVHFWIGSDPYVSAAGGCPEPGTFSAKFENLGGVSSYSFDYDISGDVGVLGCNAFYHVICHALVHNGAQPASGWSNGDPVEGASCGAMQSTIQITCNPQDPVLECVDWKTEAAFGGDTKGQGRAWWYYYQNDASTQTVYAAKTIPVGTVTYTPLVEGESGILTISLDNGWELNPDESDPVKIQGYTLIPTSRPAAGRFMTYKGSSLTVPVNWWAYYDIQLEVRKCTKWVEL